MSPLCDFPYYHMLEPIAQIWLELCVLTLGAVWEGPLPHRHNIPLAAPADHKR